LDPENGGIPDYLIDINDKYGHPKLSLCHICATVLPSRGPFEHLMNPSPFRIDPTLAQEW
jgi:hypothetical protein